MDETAAPPLKRTPGLKAAIAAGVLVYALLFVLTTFPLSPTAEARATAYFSRQEIEQGLRFAVQRRLFFWGVTALQLVFLGFMVFTGFGRKLADFWARVLPRPQPARRFLGFLHWATSVLLVGAFCFLAVELLVLPVRLGRLENARAWGMTDRSVGSWFEDYAKSLAVTGVIGGVVLLGLYVLIRLLPRGWWAVGATASILLGFFYAFLLPEVINPLFNTFTPLRDPALLLRVRALAERAGEPVETVLVVDASRQGRHTNAYFTGFGPTRRIVLFDTLLRPLDTLAPEPAVAVVALLSTSALPGLATAGPLEAGAVVVAHRREVTDEIESILAHEIGHMHYRHILKGILLAGLGAYFGLYLVSVILRWAVGRAPFTLRSPSDPAGIPLLLLLSVLGSWIALPAENLVSRHFERQADETALRLAGHPRAFIAAEQRLARDNRSNVAPTPFSVWLFASHPPTLERIQMAEDWRRGKREE